MQLRKLPNGKCEYLNGISIKFYKCKVDCIGSFFSNILGDNFIYGFASSQSLPKIVSIHKLRTKNWWQTVALSLWVLFFLGCLKNWLSQSWEIGQHLSKKQVDPSWWLPNIQHHLSYLDLVCFMV